MIRRADGRRDTVMDDEALAIQLFTEETRQFVTGRVTEPTGAQRMQVRGHNAVVRRQPSQRWV